MKSYYHNNRHNLKRIRKLYGLIIQGLYIRNLLNYLLKMSHQLRLGALVEYIFDFYWYIYKAQIPEQFGCMDSGSDFYSSLTLIGKILYLLRPLMIRRKQKKVSKNVVNICKPYKNRYDYHFDPTNSKLYFSLIANSLMTISVGKIYVGNHSSPMFTQMYDDSSAISSHYSDKSYTYKWVNGNRFTYIFTFDYCYFPRINQIQMPREIKRTLEIHNAGGSSELSETLSMYYMYLKFNAINFIPEMEVNYRFKSNICDYLMEINKKKIGVSVTRALCYPFNKTIPYEFATSLLYKKLFGIILAKKSVSQLHHFDNSVIHVWCNNWNDAYVIHDAYSMIIKNDIYRLYENIYIICSVCQANFIYTNID